jgi:hypothetical protein
MTPRLLRTWGEPDDMTGIELGEEIKPCDVC